MTTIISSRSTNRAGGFASAFFTLLLTLSINSQAQQFTFDGPDYNGIEFELGQSFSTETEIAAGVSIRGVSGDAPGSDNFMSESNKTLVLLDTLKATPGSRDLPIKNGDDGDPDLAYPWVGGNLNKSQDSNASSGFGTDTVINNIVVFAENTVDEDDNAASEALGEWTGNPDGFIDIPDDDTGGGAIRFSLSFKADEFQVDTIDFEPETACCIEFFNSSLNPGDDKFAQSNRVAQIFFDRGTQTLSASLNQFAIVGGVADAGDDDGNRLALQDSSVVYEDAGGSADNVANRLGLDVPITSEIFALGKGPVEDYWFDGVQINIAGSGGFDTVFVNQIPEPSTAMLLIAGLSALAFRRRRAG